MSGHGLLRLIGAHPVTLWTIRHLVNPIDRLVVRGSRGRLPPLTGLVVPTLLVTTIGRRTGQTRSVPLVYVRDGDNFVVGNARPENERTNPWVLNLREMSKTTIHVHGADVMVEVRELDVTDADRLWPSLVRIWPALDQFYMATGQRSVFSLQPVD